MGSCNATYQRRKERFVTTFKELLAVKETKGRGPVLTAPSPLQQKYSRGASFALCAAFRVSEGLELQWRWVAVLVLMLLVVVPVMTKGRSMNLFKVFCAFGAVTETVEKSSAIGKDGRLSVSTSNGSIRIRGGDVDEVEIVATKSASTEEALKRAEIEVRSDGNHVSVAVTGNGNVGVSFEITVPRHALLDRIKTSNGSITVEDARGDLVARTSNGSVRVEKLRGRADLATTNGSVHARDVDQYASVHATNGSVDVELAQSPDGNLNIGTSNGSVTVQAATAVDAQVELSTTVGSIRTPHNRTSGVGRLKQSVTLGKGGNTVEISTSVGSVTLKVQ